MNYLTQKINLIKKILTSTVEYSVDQLNKMNVNTLTVIHDLEFTNDSFSFEDQEKYYNSIYKDYEAIEYVEELPNPTQDQILRIYAHLHIMHKKEFPLSLKQYLAKLKESQLEESEFTQGMIH